MNKENKRYSFKYASHFVFVVALIATATHVSAETVWCRAFKLGCPTAEDFQKKFARCQSIANESYRQGLAEALADPSVWRLHGNRSAEDYAKMRQDLMMNICMQ